MIPISFHFEFEDPATYECQLGIESLLSWLYEVVNLAKESAMIFFFGGLARLV